MKFAKGNEVIVADLANDTGAVDQGGDARGRAKPPILVKDLDASEPGKIMDAREHPPHITDGGEDPNPSPHYLVRLRTKTGSPVDVWFAEARLTKAE